MSARIVLATLSGGDVVAYGITEDEAVEAMKATWAAYLVRDPSAPSWADVSDLLSLQTLWRGCPGNAWGNPVEENASVQMPNSFIVGCDKYRFNPLRFWQLEFESRGDLYRVDTINIHKSSYPIGAIRVRDGARFYFRSVEPAFQASKRTA